MRVLGKGGKERIVPFNRSTEAAIRAWLSDREAFAAGSGTGVEAGSGAERSRAAGVEIRCF